MHPPVILLSLLTFLILSSSLSSFSLRRLAASLLFYHLPARSVGNRRWWSHGALCSACIRERPLKARDRTRVCIRADSWVAEEEPRQKGGKRKGTRGGRGRASGEEAGERRVWGTRGGWRYIGMYFSRKATASRREAKRIRGKKRVAGEGRGRKRGKGARGKREREKRER